MMLPLGELSLDTVWCLFVLCLLELRLRSGGDVARLASEERGELPGDAPLHDDMPNLTSDALGEDQADLTDILYDPFDRPEGEVIRWAGSSSRSRSPPRLMCLYTCRLLPSALAGEASTSFRLISGVIKDLISMASLPASEAATPPPSTVHSSGYESSWDPLLLSETDARGSDESPCRAYHPMTFPRDGHLPSQDATGSDEFPAKSVVTEWEGLDEMGPWLRVKDTDRLLLGDRTVHWSPDCPFLSSRSFCLTQCYCADKLLNAFIMMLTTTSVYMEIAVAMKMWTLRQVSYGP